MSRRAPDALQPIDAAEYTARDPWAGSGPEQASDASMRRSAGAPVHGRCGTNELRTPLAGLKTHLQVARSQTAEPAMRKTLDRALDGVNRATHSVEQLLLLARADSTQIQVRGDATVNLRDVVVQVVSALSQQAFEREIDLGVDAPVDVMVRGDLCCASDDDPQPGRQRSALRRSAAKSTRSASVLRKTVHGWCRRQRSGIAVCRS